MATENRENDRPETEEDRFAAAVEAERVAKEQAKAEKPAPAAEARTDTAAAPTEGQPQRPRDESGRFAPTPPPFEGYDKLDPKAREYVDRLRGDHDGLRRKLIRSQNDIRDRDKALREYASGTRKPATQGARATEAPVASRNNPTPTPQQQQADTKAWEAYRAQYPDDAKAFEELVKAREAELGRKLSEVEQRLARIDEIESKLSTVSDVAARYEAREQESVKAEGRGYFDQAAPNWEYLAGWKDEQGRPVPREEQAYAPDFQAWLDAIRDHSPSVADMYEAQLEHHDPRIVAKVWQDFNRDYHEATGAPHPMLQRRNGNEETRPRAPENPVQQRREAARNDVNPRPSGSAGGGRVNPVPNDRRYSPRSAEEEAFAAAVSGDNMQRWRGLRT
jgi:hypothetical protein